MNFKRFHESKNLLNRATDILGYRLGQDGLPFRDSAYEVSEFIAISPNTYISRSENFTKNRPLCEYDAEKNHIKRTVSGSSVLLTNNTYYVRTAVEQTDVDVMLNTGSTPQPYEPYSSEVWHDIPYYQHKTATDTLTLPAVIYPNDTSITVGLKGNEEHIGTPSPSNPVDVNGTGERTENLLDYSTVTIGKYIDASGQEATSSSSGENALNHSDYIPIVVGTTYTFKCSKAVNYTGASNAFCWFDSSKQLISRDLFDVEGGSKTILGTATAPTGAAYLIMNYRGLHGDTGMLNTGSTALPYEPFGYKIPISMGGTTNNVYLGEVQTEREIQKLVLTGQEDWKLWSSDQPDVERYYYKWGKTTPSDYGLICTHFPFTKSDGNFEHIRLGGSIRDDIVIFISKTIAPTLADFKTYLQQQYAAGTPVTVWYVLATPTTGIVNEPLMKIGSYSDSLSTTIPCTAGSNSFDVDTTVQPSKVTANYQGWHPVQSVHERTAQMFDKDNADLYEGTSLSIANKWYYAGGQATIIRIPCEASTIYTLKITASNTVFRISTVSTDDVPSEGNDVVVTTIVNSGEITEYTFTTSSDTKYILFQGSYAVLSTILNTLMLNKGSTAQPYEPYWD
jgi:hypothetical protein